MSKWKNFEKSIADIFATKRTPFSGSNSGVTHSDSLHDRIFIECKDQKSNSAVLNLMKSTEELARKEKKVPMLALRNPEDEKKQKYIMFNIKDLYKVIREIDLHKIDPNFPEDTTIYKLSESISSDGFNLSEIKNEITIQIKQIIRNKIVSNEDLEDLQYLFQMKDIIESVLEYQNGE